MTEPTLRVNSEESMRVKMKYVQQQLSNVDTSDYFNERARRCVELWLTH